MKIEKKILFFSFVVAIVLLGCGDNKEKKDYQTSITQKTKEALGDENGSGCNGDGAKENQECSEEDDSSSSSFILSKLEKDDDNKNQSSDNDSLREQLDTLMEDITKEEAKKIHLEKLVDEVENIAKKDSKKIAQGLENLVDSYHKENSSNNIKNELISLVEEVENSKTKREKVEQELLSLVDEVEKKKIKREEVEKKLLEIVGEESEIKKTKQSLENLVNSAEKKGTKEAKRLASSILKDVSKKKIKILKTEEDFVVIQVQVGDNLSSLASKYYGDAKKYKIIYEANKDKIGKKHTIYPGTTLVIPKI